MLALGLAGLTTGALVAGPASTVLAGGAPSRPAVGTDLAVRPDAEPALPTSPTSTSTIVDVFSAQVMAVSGSTTVTPAIVFVDGASGVVSSVAGQAVLVRAGQWTSLPPTVALAPAAATSAHGQVVGDGPVRVRHELLLFRRVATPPVVGPLHTSGNQIVQANGHPVVLHGVDLTALLSPGTTPPVTQEEIESIRAWGANLVRISVGEQLLLPDGCQYDPDYGAKLAQVVRWVTDLGMVALIDLHESEPVLCLGAGDQDMADDPGSVSFWQTVAGTFASNPLVAFDLYNEPHDISDAVWLDGGTATDYLPYQAAGMQELYDAVRSTGARNLVFVSGNDWATEPPSQLVSGRNIVYSVHDYTCPQQAPPACSSPHPYDPATILRQWTALAATVPVFIGEFGWPSAGDGTYNQTLVALARRLGWGWDAFSWNTGGFGLLAPGSTAEPNPAGMPILAALARI